MHPCLLIEEIQRTIFSLLIIEDDKQKDREEVNKTLAHLARTCRAFHTSALDVLWDDLESLERLLHCLPDDLFEYHILPLPVTPFQFGDTSGCREMRLARPMGPSDWSILKKYTYRIRSATFNPCIIYDAEPLPIVATLIDSTIYQALCLPPTFSRLFPNLRRLDFPAEDTHLSLLQVLLSPSLRALSLQAKDWLTPSALSMLSSVGSLCPNLKIFDMRPGRSPADLLAPGSHVIHSISRFILRLEVLEELECLMITEDAFKHLAQVGTFRRLDLALPFPTHLIPYFSQFNNLRYICLCLDNIRAARDLIKLLRAPLEVLELTFEGQDSSPELLKNMFQDTLATSDHTATSLTRYQLSEMVDESEDNPLLVIDDFRPLLQLRNLAFLTIDVQCTIDLDDAGIVEMARAWPMLEFLHLNYAGWTTPTGITPVGLIGLLTHCPKLSDLGIAVDFTTLPEPLPAHPLNTRIKVLEAGTSPIDEPFAVAEFLARILPNVIKVVGFVLQAGDTADATTYHERWVCVSSILSSGGERSE
ncbi:hypothetical protein BU15DRAFT_76731 [Melanogaster broomeanus]|nr:hypothetical protein BU15DRAFT_76731 [Melanogaster broomeanus]